MTVHEHGEGPRLRVDPVACDGVGVCAALAPDVVTLDRWGYPVIGPISSAGGARRAGRAVRACPRRALWTEGEAAGPVAGS